MSLSTALNSAISGLQVTSRGTQVVADNIANAGTDGYGVRTLTQAARSVGGTGGGVIATGVQRDGDILLLGNARTAAGDKSAAAITTTFWTQIENVLGSDGAANSLVARVAEFDAALSGAIVSPDSRAALVRIAQSAVDLTRSFHTAHQTIAQARDTVDAEIARDTNTLNDLLAQVARLNRDIQFQSISGASPNALMDQRQRITDQIGLILPVTEIPRDHGRIMLLAADGTILLDQNPVMFEFQRSPQPQASDTVLNNGVAPLRLGTREIGFSNSILGSGRLGAAFRIRDDHAITTQAALDNLARDLITRFSAPTLDSTNTLGGAGLFQDQSGAQSTTNAGLSRRLTLAPSISPDDPASLFRLRDGLGATTPGPTGATDVLSNLREALRASTLTGITGQSQRDFHGHSVDLIADITGNRLRAEAQDAEAASRAAFLAEQVLARGVDSDDQMQKLLVLEQNYVANARVITTIDAMMRTLLEI